MCSVLTLLALGTSMAISTVGQEACRGLWAQHAPQCQLCLCGLLVILIECIALEKGYKHSAFATNVILSSTVRAGAGPLDPSGPSQSPCSLWARSGSEAVKTQPSCDPCSGVTRPLVLVAQEGRASGGKYPFFWLENVMRPVLSQIPSPLEQTMLCRICFRIWVAFTAVK